jgi:hypothetical protein
MELYADGGDRRQIVSITPTDNPCKRGFCQISLEAFFRALRNENGFKLIDYSLRVSERELRSFLVNYGVRTGIPMVVAPNSGRHFFHLAFGL